MKKTLLWSALFALLSSQIHAESTAPAADTTTNSTPPVSSTPNETPDATQSQPAPSDSQKPSAQKPDVLPATPSLPAATDQPQQAPSTQPMNCSYKISADVKKVDQSVVLAWAEKAVTQSFDMDHTAIDTQMQNLQPCFTEQGWIGFNNALQKSGNIEAIKAQKLNVSSQLDGQPEVTELKENQWKVTLPLQVVYQNDKEKVTQLLQIGLTVGRKASGDLGIMQMIATPRATEPAAQTPPKAPVNKDAVTN